MSTTTSAPAAKRVPVTLKVYSSAAAYITLRKWPDRDTDHGKEPGNAFVEVAQDTGEKDAQQKAVWTRVRFELSDLSGVIESLSRAKNLGIAAEDSR